MTNAEFHGLVNADIRRLMHAELAEPMPNQAEVQAAAAHAAKPDRLELGAAAVGFLNALVTTGGLTDKTHPVFVPMVQKLISDWDIASAPRPPNHYPLLPTPGEVDQQLAEIANTLRAVREGELNPLAALDTIRDLAEYGS